VLIITEAAMRLIFSLPRADRNRSAYAARYLAPSREAFFLTSFPADAFARVFQKDFYVDKELVKHEVLRKGMFNLIHNRSVIKVDFYYP